MEILLVSNQKIQTSQHSAGSDDWRSPSGTLNPLKSKRNPSKLWGANNGNQNSKHRQRERVSNSQGVKSLEVRLRARSRSFCGESHTSHLNRYARPSRLPVRTCLPSGLNFATLTAPPLPFNCVTT